MPDNHQFLEPTGPPPTGTQTRTVRAIDIASVLHPVAALVRADTGAALLGQAARLASLPVALSNEDAAALDAILAALTSVAVTGPLTDAELRAAPVGVAASALPLPVGAATEATLASGVGLRGDATAQHGLYTLSATPNTVTSISLPGWARIVRLINPSAICSWRVDADPAPAGSGTLTDGGFAINGETTAIILPTGAATIRVLSATSSATLRIEVRG